MSRKHGANRRAMTLAELLVALAIVTLIMAGLGSALMIATQALPARMSTQQSRIDVSDALDRFDSELACALFVSEHTASAITFTVADRDGDGNPERIRYAWSGITGAPVTRDYNGQGAQPVISAASTFALGYSTQTVTVTYPGIPVEDFSETLLGNYSSGSVSAQTIKANSWAGQFVRPSLPGDALFWRITRVRASIRRNRLTAMTGNVAIYSAGSGSTPTGAVMEQQPLPTTLSGLVSSLLSGFSDYWIVFGFNHHLRYDEGACLIIQQFTGADGTIDVGIDSANNGLVTGSASNWSVSSSRTMQYSCYGFITRAGANTSFDRAYLKCVRAQLTTSTETAVRRVDIATLNKPELLSGYWELDGTRIPTAVNINGDATMDWIVTGGTPLVTPPSGALRGDAVYAAAPDVTFTGKTTVDVRFRALTPNQDGDVLRLAFNRGGGKAEVVVVSSSLLNDGSQTLSVLSEARNSLYEKSGLSSGLIDVRLILDGAIGGVNVSVNGAAGETAALISEPLVDTGPNLKIGRLNSDVEIDWVRIRMN